MNFLETALLYTLGVVGFLMAFVIIVVLGLYALTAFMYWIAGAFSRMTKK